MMIMKAASMVHPYKGIGVSNAAYNNSSYSSMDFTKVTEQHHDAVYRVQIQYTVQ
jgi:hypothetical protein